MEIIRRNDKKEIVQFIDYWCEKNIQNLSAKSLFLPAGNTLIPLYEAWEKKAPSYLNGVELFQVDDVITGVKKWVFKDFFQEKLPSFQNQFNYIDSTPKSCELAILGLGLNGHVAFHEPGIDKDFDFGKVTLTDQTCDHLEVPHKTQGLSYGVGTFLKCKKILLVVSGRSKKEILEKLLAKKDNIPAAYLLDHKGLTILVDSAASKTI